MGKVLVKNRQLSSCTISYGTRQAPHPKKFTIPGRKLIGGELRIGHTKPFGPEGELAIEEADFQLLMKNPCVVRQFEEGVLAANHKLAPKSKKTKQEPKELKKGQEFDFKKRDTKTNTEVNIKLTVPEHTATLDGDLTTPIG